MKNRPSEFELIAEYFAPLAGRGAFGLQDDAALLAVPEGQRLVVTQDALAANVHFFADDPPKLVAQKALRVNISDLVAKGALPFAYSLAIGLDGNWDEAWIADFAQGLGEDQAMFKMHLNGGDTYASPGGTTISITAFGLLDVKNYTSRLGASIGDTIFVTGTIGDAALGLQQRLAQFDSHVLKNSETNHLHKRYLLPNPSLLMAPIIGEFASASMDISDGLVGDLEKLCKASNVGARIELSRIPMSVPVKKVIQKFPQLLETALTGGDDYELLFTVSEMLITEFEAAICQLPIAIEKIGVVKDVKDGIGLFDNDGSQLLFETGSYKHF